MIDFIEEAQGLFPYTRELRRDFHRHPELGFQEGEKRGHGGAWLKDGHVGMGKACAAGRQGKQAGGPLGEGDVRGSLLDEKKGRGFVHGACGETSSRKSLVPETPMSNAANGAKPLSGVNARAPTVRRDGM